jgi:hypothetical protein
MSSIIIADKTCEILEWDGQRVITFKMIDALHERPEGAARKTFSEHRERFICDVHYLKVTASVIRTRLQGVISDRASGEIVLLTERGYLMLVKTFNDDMAWQIQDALVECYFRGRSITEPPPRADDDGRLALDRRLADLERRVVALERTSSHHVESYSLDAAAKILGVDAPTVFQAARGAQIVSSGGKVLAIGRQLRLFVERGDGADLTAKGLEFLAKRLAVAKLELAKRKHREATDSATRPIFIDARFDQGQNNDNQRPLETILSAKIRVADGVEYTVADLAIAADSILTTPDQACTLTAKEANRTLETHGMKVVNINHKSYLALSNTSLALRRLVSDTPYAGDLRGYLLREYDVIKLPINVRFDKHVSKCLGVSISVCRDILEFSGSIKKMEVN